MSVIGVHVMTLRTCVSRDRHQISRHIMYTDQPLGGWLQVSLHKTFHVVVLVDDFRKLVIDKIFYVITAEGLAAVVRFQTWTSIKNVVQEVGLRGPLSLL